MKTPIVLNLKGIPEIIVGIIESSEEIEQAIIEGELVFVPDFSITKDGKELNAIGLEWNKEDSSIRHRIRTNRLFGRY